MPNIKPSRLWLARKRSSYEQKQIAALLGYKTIQQISRYETGLRIPSLKIALKLSIIYKLPIRVLFPACYRECCEELSAQVAKTNNQSNLKFDLTEATDYCAYIALMNSSFMTDIDKEKIRRHIKQLIDGRREKILHN
jgi:transcriptional regulator with XRE-family HTH domain